MKARPIVAIVLLLPLLLLAGCGQKIADRMVVQIAYTGTLPDGTVFDESTKEEPFQFMIGVGMMPPALEAGLMGLRKGATKHLVVKAADGFGERDETSIQEVPRSEMPEDLTLEVGSTLTAQTAGGTQYVTILEVKDESVLLDFNHPLAGKDLTFDITVMDVHRPSVEEMSQFPTQ